ncbi:MAG: tetratricopeptide repeat protein [Limnohabitans sp.]|uniref:tetratricopeptide repeat protein n=1 Tax=Limnohabitans sp. TaxID=1907725 RepID=UPI0025E37DBD|nr:tetratricopeptide repeat protein [Limnohabitans sp.]MCO4089948.1 tetratricopeptide repeat protein [Limnohabitans sp.]
MESSLEQARQAFLDGVELFERQQFERAASFFERALQLAPGRPSVLMNLGASWVQLGHFERADECLRQALAADDQQCDAWVAWGVTQMALGDWPQALHCHEQARALGADGAGFCLRWGQCLARAGRLPQALQAFGQALAHDPGLAEAWSQRAHVFRDTGQTEQAIADYQRALQLGAEPELHRYYLAALSPQQPVVNAPLAYVEKLFDQYAEDFEAHLVAQLGYQGHSVLLQQLPVEPTRRFERVWDLGCGTGLCGPLVRHRADHLTGVDLSSAMVAKAQSLGVYDSLHAQELVTFLQQNTTQADLVLAADVFIYVGWLEAAFEALSPRMQPGGWLAFTVEESEPGLAVQLHSSLRYAHGLDYLQKLAAQHGWRWVKAHRASLRLDQAQPLMGVFVYMQKIE